MKTLIVFVCSTTLLLSACMKAEQKDTQSDGAEAEKKSSKPVDVITVSLQQIPVSDMLPGRVEALNTAEIRPQVSGIIESLFFEQGSLVEKGQQLYQIDAATFEAEYQRAEANLRNARAELELANTLLKRNQSLIETNAISKQELDEAQANQTAAASAVALAEAEVKAANINLNYTKVYSPISGYIGPSSVTKGALVTARQASALAVVRQLDPIYVDLTQNASVTQTIAGELLNASSKSEQQDDYEVTLYVGEDREAYPLKGTVFATDLAVDEMTSTMRLRAIFPNHDAMLLPGMFVRASIDQLGTQRAIIVPHKAVNIEPDGSKTLWLVSSNNTATKQEVVTASSYENNWIIKSGLNSGDTVIVKGTMMLRPGAKVDPNNISNAPNSNGENTASTENPPKDQTQ